MIFNTLLAVLLFPIASSALVDNVTYGEMKYIVHHAFDAYAIPNCSYPEGTTLIANWTTGVKGYLAADHMRKWLIVSFRGTHDDEDSATDGQKTLVPYTVLGSEDCSNCSVHEGIQKQWNKSAKAIVGQIESAKEKNLGYKIYVTGHSLGGAYAAFAGTTIARAFGIGNVTSYSFAAFRVGDKAYAAYQDASFPGTTYHRVTSMNDNVPARATTMEQGYRHGGTEYWIQKEPDPSPQDIKVCSGSEDPTCNDGQWTNGTGINAAHGVYFIDSQKSNCVGNVSYLLRHPKRTSIKANALTLV